MLKVWTVQIKFLGKWVEIARDFPTRGDAEWTIGKWKQEMNCTGDSEFRTVQGDSLFRAVQVVEESGR